MHIAEKYTSLARDAMASGDSVAAENYLQHAEHYNRIILAAQAQNAGLSGMEQPNGVNGGRFHQGEPFQRDFDGDSEEGDGEDFVPQPQQRSFQERPVYNQNQPQPFIPQNAFPQVQQHLQPVSPVSNGAAPHTGESFAPAEGQGQRRRRRRPLGDHQARGFNGRHGGQPGSAMNGPAPAGNGGAPASDPAPDETSSS
jgi:hypothetical protein